MPNDIPPEENRMLEQRLVAAEAETTHLRTGVVALKAGEEVYYGTLCRKLGDSGSFAQDVQLPTHPRQESKAHRQEEEKSAEVVRRLTTGVEIRCK